MIFASFRRFCAVAANRNSSFARFGPRRRNRSSLIIRFRCGDRRSGREGVATWANVGHLRKKYDEDAVNHRLNHASTLRLRQSF